MHKKANSQESADYLYGVCSACSAKTLFLAHYSFAGKLLDVRKNMFMRCGTCGDHANLAEGRYLVENDGKTLSILSKKYADFIKAHAYEQLEITELVNPAITSYAAAVEHHQKGIIQESHCCRCGSVFPSEMYYDYTGYARPPVGTTTVVGNCPNCRKEGETGLPPGLYQKDEYSNQITRLGDLLSGPEFTPEVLLRLKTLVEQTQAEPEKANEFLEKVNDISPSLSKSLDSWLGERKNIIDLLKLILPLTVSLILARMALQKSQPTPTPAPIISNTYNFPTLNPLSAKQKDDLHKLQRTPTAPRGSNLTPSKKKKSRKK